MAKIGSAGSGDEPTGGQKRQQPSDTSLDPFAAIARPLGRTSEAPGVSWWSAIRKVASGLALDWFSDYPQMTLREYLEGQESSDSVAGIALSHMSNNRPHWLEESIVPAVLEGAESLGEFVPLSQSTFYPAVRDFVSSKNVVGTEIPVFALGGALADVGAMGGLSWQGAWPTEFGSRSFTRIEFYRDSSGTEWCYVHTNLLVATRKPLGLGQSMAEYLALPRQILSQLFIAETPFPSSMAAFSRQIAYEGVPPEHFPRPLVGIEKPGLVTHVESSPGLGQKIEHYFNSFPQVLRAGYAFSDKAIDHLEVLLSGVVDSVAHLATIAEDGFRNYREPGHDAHFDHWYGSEYVFFEDDGFYPGITAAEGLRAAGYSRWVPETMMGDLIAQTERVVTAAAEASDPQEARKLLEWVVSEGAGFNVSAAINTLCFSHLMPEKQWATAEHLLNIAIDLDHMNEATNALCNLGQLYFASGRPDEAKEALKRALERSDGYAETEASYELGVIHEQEGDLDGARQYFERGASATVKNWFDEEYIGLCKEKLSQSDAPRVDAIASPGLEGTARFCVHCGAALFAGARFCAQCGGAVS